MDTATNVTARLAELVAGDFYENRLDLSSRYVPAGSASWDSMPEVEAARKIKARGAPGDTVRLFLTFIAAMDRARDAGVLWRAGVELFELHPEGAHSRFPGHALTPTGVMAIRCKQFHLPDL